MGIIITPQAEIDAYFESSALSQSSLKLLLKGYHAFVENRDSDEDEKGEKSHLIIGSAVDLLLTGEEGEFQKQYYVSTLEKKPSSTEKSALFLKSRLIAQSNRIKFLLFILIILKYL